MNFFQALSILGGIITIVVGLIGGAQWVVNPSSRFQSVVISVLVLVMVIQGLEMLYMHLELNDGGVKG